MSTQTSTKPNKLQVQQLIFQHSGDDLTHQEFRVLAVMMSYSRGNLANAYPGHARIMKAIGCKDRKRVSDLLKSLVAKGYLVKVSPHTYGKGKSKNMAENYTVVVPKWIEAEALATNVDNPLLVDNEDASSTAGDGVMSTPGDGVMSTPTLGVVSTPSTRDASRDVSRDINPCTVKADASTAPKESKDGKGKVVHMSPTRMLHHKPRRMIFDAMYSVGTQWEDDEHLLALLGEHYNDGVSGWAANYWTWRPVTDEYEAAEQLNLLVHSAVRDLGDEYLMPNNPQHAA